MGTVNYKGTAVRATATLGLGGVDITQWPVLRPEVDAINTNIMLNAFRIAINGGLSILGMIDGIVDEFEDETGVDTAQSVNEAYDATGDYYHNLIETGTEDGGHGVGSSSGNWTILDRSWALNNGSPVYAISVYCDTAINLVLKIAERTAASTYDIVHSDSVNHTGSGWETFRLSSVYSVPASGDFYLGLYTDGGTISVSTISVARSYLNGQEATGTDVTMTEQNAVVPVLRAHYGEVQDMTLLANAATAAAQPDEAHLVLFEEDVDAVTENTDLSGWVSRDAGRAFTTDYASDDKLDLASHGFANDDRVTVESSGTLPAGLSAGVLYYVVNQTANDFELSLTSGGAAVDITDDGSGTHAVFKWSQVTLADEGNYDTNQRILSGTQDISGQPAGMNMRWLVTTANIKELKLHGTALEWR